MADDSNLDIINTPPGNFKWTDENIPLITPEYFIYDNSDQASWEELKNINSYPKPKDNNASSSISADDNFNTHNNITYANYFEHKQGSIRPLKDQSLDAWFDVGLKSVMFNNGVPYTTPNFQKTFYVWYINGDGSDYPYDNHVGIIYPGQEKNFAYRYNDLSKVVVKSGNVIKIKGNTPSFRYGNAKDGFFAKLNNPGEQCNCLAKIDLGLIEKTGQRWHYQGFTLISKNIFKKYPTTTVNLDMKGEDVELDITALIDVNIDWKFSLLELISSNPSICTIESDWISNPNDPDFGNKPTFIKLKGNPDVQESTVNIIVRARPIGTTYTEEISFNVRIKQLYNKDTFLEITPKHIITMVGVETEYEVQTDASSYTVTTDNRDLIRLYKGKVQGVKQGTGILTFKAQAPLSRLATVKVPFTVNKYIPKPSLETPEYNISVEEDVLRETYIITNCPKANIKIKASNEKVVALEEAIVWEDLEQDTEFPRRKCTFKFRGITTGTSNINIQGYITEGDVVVSKNISVAILEKPIIPEPPTTDDTGEFGQMTKTDAYIAFHHQREGVMTYLKSKSKNIPADKVEEEVDKLHTANKIIVVPEVSNEDIELNQSNEFHLALKEDITQQEEANEKTNPNYLDYKENYNPVSGFKGNNLRDYNYWLNKKTGERFIKEILVDDTVRWKGNKGTTVGVIDVQKDGLGPAPHEISSYYGLRALQGCHNPLSDNYANYQDEHGCVYVYIPLHFVSYITGRDDTNAVLHNIEIYWPLTMDHTNYMNFTLTQDYPSVRLVRDQKGNIIDLNQNEDLKKKLRIPAAFINNNTILPGLFIKKYPNGNETIIGNNKFINTVNSNGINKNKGSRVFEEKSNVNNNSNNLSKDVGDDIWSNVLSDKSISGLKSTTYTSRISKDLSFTTLYIRKMLSDLIINNVVSDLYNTNNSTTSYLNDDGSKPYTGKTNNGVDQLDTGLGSYELDGINYGYDIFNKVKYSHNGRKSGIYGLSDGNLEIVIGAYMVCDMTISDNSISKTALKLNAGKKTTDYKKLTNDWIKAVTNFDSIPSLPEVGSDIGIDILPTSVINNKLLTQTKTEYPVRLKSDYNIITKYGSIETDVSIPKVNNDSHLNYFKINMGITGAYIENNSPKKRTDYNSRTYNSLSKFNIHIDHINLGDATTSFFISKENSYTEEELKSNFSFYMIPMCGGILNYKSTKGVIDISNLHHDSITWYRMGYNLSMLQDEDNNKVDMKVFSRFVIMPDMELIKTYVDSGEYEINRNNEIDIYGDTTGLLPIKQTDTNKWE